MFSKSSFFVFWDLFKELIDFPVARNALGVLCTNTLVSFLVLEPSVIEELIEETNWMQNRRTWNSDKPESKGFYTYLLNWSFFNFFS